MRSRFGPKRIWSMTDGSGIIRVQSKGEERMELPIDVAKVLGLSSGSKAPRPGAVEPGLEWQEAYARSLGQQAYVWGFPWLYLTQLCWLWTSEAGKKLA